MVFWTKAEGKALLFYMEEKETWSAPKPAWFLQIGSNEDVPFFSDDGEKLYFISDRTISDKRRLSEENIWYTEKKDNRWSEPFPLPIELGKEQLHWQFSFSKKGTLYFTATVDNGKGGYGRYDIYKSESIDGVYGKPELLGAQFNTAESDAMPFIAPDESYLIFSSSREGGFGKSDLYASFRNNDDSWTDAVNLGPDINSSSHDICPIVTHDGKYLFFVRGFGDVYWVDAKTIEALRLKE
jgi:Tol biopolymer transport system component